MKRTDLPSRIVDLALNLGATDVAVKLIERKRTMIRFSNNEVTAFKSYREALIDIFLMVGKHRAGSTISLSPLKKVESAVERLIKVAKMSPPADVYAPLPKGPFRYDPSLLKPSKVSLAPRRLVGHVEAAIKGALEAGAKRAAGSLTATKTQTVLATSGGAQGTQEKTSLEISVRAFTSEVSSGHFVSIAQDEENFRPEEAGRVAGEIAVSALNPTPGKPGRYTALLGPLVFADLVSQVGVLSSAFLVDVGQSFLAGRIGSEVASEEFTLLDDPTLSGSYGARAFDDEGVPTRRNTIVDRGVLETYLHNSTTAKKFDTETTGNAGLIVPRPWNLVVEPGDKTFEELLSEIDRGLYVTNDWYLRYQNYRTGDFSTIPRDGLFLIKGGEVEGAVRELRISDNMIRVFKNIRALSKSRFWIKWWEVEVPTLTPYAVVEDLNFTKSTM